jgi:ATP-dependent Clp protease ATP-binding subunit ClpC
MYERFSDYAKEVMYLANQEAQRFNHEYIGTEHILLGLIEESKGVAAKVFKNLNVNLSKVRLEVEKLVQSGPNMVTMGSLPQTPRAKKVIEYAIEEAHGFKHNYIGTEHILLGLLREMEGVAAQVLMNLSLKLEEVREEILRLSGEKPNTLSPEQPEPELAPAEEEIEAPAQPKSSLVFHAENISVDDICDFSNKIETFANIFCSDSKTTINIAWENGQLKATMNYDSSLCE